MITRRGYYFEEFEVGQKITSSSRTITEGDIVSFAGLSGDFNQIHTDKVFAQSTRYEKRIAHGLLIISIASGLLIQTGILEGTVIAFREIENLKFRLPVFIGDTISSVVDITDKQLNRRLGGGIVNFNLKVVNQQQDVVAKGNLMIIVKLKAEDGTS